MSTQTERNEEQQFKAALRQLWRTKPRTNKSVKVGSNKKVTPAAPVK